MTLSRSCIIKKIGGRVKILIKKHEMMYIPIIKSLQQILNNKSAIREVKQNVFCVINQYIGVPMKYLF